MGNTVHFDTIMSFDVSTAVNMLAHDVCAFDDFLQIMEGSPAALGQASIGLIEFHEGFVFTP